MPSEDERDERTGSARTDSELVEYVDPTGRVNRLVTRSEMRAQGLRHRATYVAVITRGGEIIVHQRADWKDVWPSFWDIGFGGVCGVGEDWGDAASRELGEEAGITAVVGRGAGFLTEVGSLVYDGCGVSVIGRGYVLITDEVPTCTDGEVVRVDRIDVAALPAWMAERDVCPDSRDAFWPLIAEHQGLDSGPQIDVPTP